MKSFSVNCGCNSEKMIRINSKILDSISDYHDEMESYFYNNKLTKNELLSYFKDYPLPPLPFDPFAINYLIIGIDPQNYFSPFLLSKLCQVFDVEIHSHEFFGKELVDEIKESNLDTNKDKNKYLITNDHSSNIDFALYESKLNNLYKISEKESQKEMEIVSIHKISTWSDSKALVINKGSKFISHEMAQLLEELNLIFFSYELELIQQLRGKEKSRTELEFLQNVYIFTDWGTIYPYVFPQENFKILEDQKILRKRKFG